MSYFTSPFAEMCATRIKALLNRVGIHDLYARPSGRVMAQYNGHMHLFGLDSDSNLTLLDTADLSRPKVQHMVITE